MNTTKLSNYNNHWYQPGPLLKRLLWLLISFFFFEHSLAVCNGLKCFWLRIFGAQIGTGLVIKPSVRIKYPWKLSVGEHCWIGEQFWIDNLDLVTLGDFVCLSQGALLLCGNHNYKSPDFDLIVAPIVLEHGSWIGAKAIVGPGVRVRSHAVLSMGSVAAASLEAYGIYRGHPAIKIKDRIIK